MSERELLLAGFQVSINGRFCVSTEDRVPAPTRNALGAIAAIALASLTACATFTRENDFPEAQVLGQLDPLPRIETSVGEFNAHLEGGKLVSSHAQGRLLKESLVNRWEAEDLVKGERFVSDQKFTGKAPYELVFEGKQEGKSNILLQLLSGATFFVLPYTVDTTRDLRVTRRDAKTGEITTATARTRQYTLVSLLLLPFLPFEIAGDIRQNRRMADSLYCQLWPTGCEMIDKPVDRWRREQAARSSEQQGVSAGPPSGSGSEEGASPK